MGGSIIAFVLVVLLGLLVVGVIGLVVALAVAATNSEDKTEQLDLTKNLLEPSAINPATGLPMVGGLDTGRNLYGFQDDSNDHERSLQLSRQWNN